jgi:hypothetical protein
MGAQSNKKMIELLSTRLFGSDIGKECINLKKGELYKPSPE